MKNMIQDKSREKVRKMLKGKTFHSIGSIKEKAKVTHYTVIAILKEMKKQKLLETVMTSSGERYRLKA